jgi:uncharacterized protein YjbI with pentapeptide repeats
MKILKPDTLALMYRTLRFARRDSLAIGMIAGFRFGHASLDALLPENLLWPVVTEALGRDAILDEGYPKPAGEYKVYGAAHAPAGTEVTQQRVAVTVGALSKALIVSGDRQFSGAGSITAAKAYSRMPITPATAFGGEGYDDNPSGKGVAAIVDETGVQRWPLPNVETEARRLAVRGEQIAPAGFWGFDMTAPLRQQYLGACDERWLKQDWPNLPADTRPELFLGAPPDQRLPGYFAGDEAFTLDNLHPRERRLRGALPALRARCFVNLRTPDGESLREVQTRAETLWLFPELECGVVLYRALADIADTDGADVLHLMAEWERMQDAPLPFEHYREQFHARVAEAKGAEPLEPLAPVTAAQTQAPDALAVSLPAVALPAAAANDPALAAQPHLAVAQQLADGLNVESRARMAQHNLTEADLARFLQPEAPERTLTLPEVEQMAARLEAESRARMQQYNLTDADIARFMEPETETVPTLAEIGKLADVVKAQALSLMQQHNLSAADVARALPAEGTAGAMPLPFTTGDSTAALATLAGALAPLVKPPSPPALALPGADADAAASARTLSRDDVIARHAARASLGGYDLTCVDLSKLDLSGADFTGAILDKTSFKGSLLADANFTQALLPNADFSECDLQRARFSRASASKSVFANADLQGAQLNEGDFTGADLSGSKLMNAELSGAVFDQAKLAGADASACRAEGTSFTDGDLAGAKFNGARLKSASFSGSRLAACDFTASACRETEFYAADAQQAVFTDADLGHSRADAASCFDDARFTRTRLERAAWDGVQIRRASFERAVIDHADLSNAQAQATRFGASSAKGARFVKADLSGADLDAVNLFGGSLRRAELKGARLRQANLYGVDFEGTQPTVASLEGSNIDRTILQFRPPVI